MRSMSWLVFSSSNRRERETKIQEKVRQMRKKEVTNRHADGAMSNPE
jgi:hypothetical protein